MEQLGKIIILSIALVFALFMAVYSAKSQPSSWVDQLKNVHGLLCCTNNDGRRLDDPDWDTLGKASKDYNGASGFRVFDDNAWKEVPNWAVVLDKNHDNIARVWFDRSYGLKTIRCFLQGNLL